MAPYISYSTYPSRIDGYATLPLVRDGVDEIKAADHNRLRDAIVKVETELGEKPSGTYATVADRLDDIGDVRAIIESHLAGPASHPASDITVVDTEDRFYSEDAQGVIDELSSLVETRPDYIGLDSPIKPNSGLPSFVGGGKKFIFNTSAWGTDESKNNEVGRTQMRPANGIVGIHILEISDGTPNGSGSLVFNPTVPSTLTWQAPGDLTAGEALILSGTSEGDYGIVYSSSTQKAIRFIRTSVSLPTLTITESIEIYGQDCVVGYFSVPASNGSDDGTIQSTSNITTTSIDYDGIRRHQFMISGMVYPADRGTLVLQRRKRGSVGFYPIAVLGLGEEPESSEPCAEFDTTKRASGQPAYIPTLAFGPGNEYDTITLYDRLPLLRDYSDRLGPDGNPIYDNWFIEYHSYQIAKYLIPVSNSILADGALEPLTSYDFSEVNDKISAYRVVHFKPGIVDFELSPAEDNAYSIVDSFVDGNNGDNTIRFSNILVAGSTDLPLIQSIYITPVSNSESTAKTLSGIHYYNGINDKFNLMVQSENNVFENGYLLDNVLELSSNEFSFPDGLGGQKNSLGIEDLMDDGYVLFSPANIPKLEKAIYAINSSYNTTRRLYPKDDSFNVASKATAVLNNPFVTGTQLDGYNDENRDRILINSYDQKSTIDTEYFTDEIFRVVSSESFDSYGAVTSWDSAGILDSDALQCGARLSVNQNICGLIYPQDDYSSQEIYPFQKDETVLIPPNILLNYSSLTGDRYYQRLFSLNLTTTSARLKITSGGDHPITFNDISYNNAARFGKIEVKIPGDVTQNATAWMDITRLYQTEYEFSDGHGALNGAPIEEGNSITIPFTFGIRNNSDAGNTIAIRITYFGDTPTEVAESKQKIITCVELLRPEF